jgi:hypothetical protein
MRTFQRIVSFTMACMCLTPSVVTAQNITTHSPLLISEIQTESAVSANEEFVEIINAGTVQYSLNDLVVEYRAATGTTWSTKATLAGVLYPDGRVVVATKTYIPDIATYTWSTDGGVLASTGGNVRIKDSVLGVVYDTAAWGTGLFGEGLAAAKAAKGFSLSRKVTVGKIHDTDHNDDDFEQTIPTPISLNEEPADVVSVVGDVSMVPPVVGSVSPSSTPPTSSDVTPTTTELPIEPPAEPLIVPVPQTPILDSGVGLIEPALTDSPGVPVVLNTDPVPVQSPVEAVVPSPVPVDEQNNSGPAPVPGTPAGPETNIPQALLRPYITELMINPTAPLTDADDEFVELYNPNIIDFSLQGFRLQTGSTFSHSYSFTDDFIPALGFLTIYSLRSNLALSNAAGAARLIDSAGVVQGAEVRYEDVEDGNSYSLKPDGAWGWSTTKTPLALNIVTSPTDVVKAPVTPTPKLTAAPKTPALPKVVTKTAPVSATPKATTVKAATTPAKTTALKASAVKTAATKTATKTAATERTVYEKPPEAPSANINTPLLALIGSLAVLYSVYEYRDDLYRALRKLRRNPIAR